MNRSQFERIYQTMAREYGKMEKADEPMCSHIAFAIESNAVKVWRKNPAANSRQMRSAIALALYDIRGRLTGESCDTSDFRNANNEQLEHAILMAFDPFTNAEIGKLLEDVTEGAEMTTESLQEIYTYPIRSLLRTWDSVNHWEKRAGSNGYFEFLERYMGDRIDGTDMDICVPLPSTVQFDD